MAEITPIATHKEDALNRLIQQYKTEIFVVSPPVAYVFTNLQKIINVYTEQVQELEDLLPDLDIRLDLDNAEGVYLDGIGDIVQRNRVSLDDATYRIFIKGKIGVNTSDGTPEHVIVIFKLLTSSDSASFLEFYPAAVAFMSTTPIVAGLEQATYDMTAAALPVGVRLSYIGTYEPDVAFRFPGAIDAGLGFGELFSQGANTSVTSFLLVDSLATFITDGVGTGDIVRNSSDDTVTTVVSVDSETSITLTDDIFLSSGKEYYIVAGGVGGKFAYLYVL